MFFKQVFKYLLASNVNKYNVTLYEPELEVYIEVLDTSNLIRQIYNTS